MSIDIISQNIINESNAIAIFTKDLNGLFTFVNKMAADQYFKKSCDEIIGKNDFDLFPFEEAVFNTKMDVEVFTTNKAQSYEKPRYEETDIFYYIIKDILKDTKQNVIGISGVVIDITKYKHEQQHLTEQKKNLEIANQIKANFIDNLSHNLRTPLVGLLGDASLLNIADNDPVFIRYPHLKQDIKLYRYSAELLLNIVSEIIDYDTFSSNKISVNKKPFKCIDLLHLMETLFSSICKEQDVLFSLKYNDICIDLIINNDLQRLVLMFHKIVTVYLRFCSMGSRLNISLTANFLNDNKQHVNFECEIKSNIMLSKKIYSRLFKGYSDFNERERDILEHANTLGLEIQIANNIAVALNGTLQYMNEIDCGIFKFESIMEISNKNLLTTDTKNLSDLCILIADDNKINLIVLKKLLQKLQTGQIITCENGFEAFQIYKSYRLTGKNINVILMDLQMPVMDGIQSTIKIREFEKEHSLSPVTIIALTAFVTDQDRYDCFNAGMNAFLGKPVTQTIILENILSFLQS